jgi:penicillin-binding protein 2
VTDRSRLRLVVLGVLVLSLLVTLTARLWFMQVVSGSEYRALADDNRIREVVSPAVRGAILDDQGRPLAENRTTLVVSVDRNVLLEQPNDGQAVLNRLSKLLDVPARKLNRQLTLCGTPEAAPAPICWNGSPYQPIPVLKDAKPTVALQIMERREDFPGVSADLQAIREYPQPFGARMAQLLGYLGPVTAEELEAAQSKVGKNGTTLTSADLVGRGGLEQQYDSYLRGKPGIKDLAVDHSGAVTGTISKVDEQPGDYLVTSLDAHVQRVVEDQLKAAIARAHTQTDPDGMPYRASSGAAIVMEVDTGRVVAMASYPDYNPNIWVGGVSTKQYHDLLHNPKGSPLINLATQGQFAPASTYKVVTTTAAVNAGYSLYGYYPCPYDLTVAGQTFHNFETSSYGDISFEKALQISCDTVFYGLAYDMWQREGGLTSDATAPDWVADTARGFGFGKPTGIDLAGEAPGTVPDRAWRRQLWLANKDFYCHFKDKGLPSEVNDPYLVKLYAELCTDGYLWQPGDAVLSAIGQGYDLATPIQVAQAYAAIANGGTIYKPQIAKAVMTPDGEVVKEFEPKVQGKLPASPEVISYLQNALQTVPEVGTAEYPFHYPSPFPLSQLPVAAKTGTGEVHGKQTTSWFASYAPADDPKFVVLMMVPEGGTGSLTSGASVRAIYEALFGVQGETVDAKWAVLPHGKPVETLPTIRPDGRIVLPKDTGLPKSDTGQGAGAGLPVTGPRTHGRHRRGPPSR